MIHRRMSWWLGAAACVVLVAGCARTERTRPGPFVDVEVPDAAPLGIPYEKAPFPGIVTGGPLTDEQLDRARESGYQTIVSLLPPAEQAPGGDAARVEASGLRYVSIPVSGAQDVTPENAAALREVLEDRGAYPVIVHCASGNRVGALFAVDAAVHRGLDVDEAVEIGRSAGLTRLEPAVREILEGPR
jgi:uncharacterized protein (TIGR01244 family)